MKRTARSFLGLVVLLAWSCIPSQAQLPVIRWEGRTMGSPYTVQIAGTNLSPEEIDALKLAVEDRLKEVNRQRSHYQPDSELSQFNRAPANIPFKVSPEFARVVRFSLELNQRSRGVFDPTLAPVINLWGFGEKTDQRAVPPELELKKALKATGCQHLSVTAKDELVKDIPDLTINLSAVAKGFGVDEMARVIRARGVTNLFVSISGEVAAFGLNTEGNPWRVGIDSPVEQSAHGEDIEAIVPLSNLAISTSGDYRKFFTDAQGRKYSHILNPKTGRPLQHNLLSVSVVAETCHVADALSTTLFVLGPEEGLRWIEQYPNASALFMTRAADGRIKKFASSKFPRWTDTKP
jgi:thiamine biosynthesis lipoprotein